MTTVYLDRRAEEQQAEEETAAALAAAEQEAKREASAKILAEVGGFFIKPAIIMLLWNWLMPGIFGLVTIGYLKALGLYVISRILFGNNTND